MPATNSPRTTDTRTQAQIAADEAGWDAVFAAEETEQENRAFAAKMRRDVEDASRDPQPAANHPGTRLNSIGTRLDQHGKNIAEAQATQTRAQSAKPAKLEAGEKERKALFETGCKRCNVRIKEGDRIAYIKGKGARHYPACPEGATPVEANAPRVRMMTSGQAQLIADLQVERGVPTNELEDDTTFAQASELIGTLIKMPRISRKKRIIELNGLREGRYAVPTEAGAENKLAFYNVTERGVFIQLSDALHAIPEAVEQAVIAKILLDPAEAARTYGREIGECGVCGRTLTNDVSRAYGIGRKCRQNTGW